MPTDFAFCAEENTRNAAVAIGARLPVLSPSEDEVLLIEAGFVDVSLFYVGFTFKGWVAYNDPVENRIE